jgi:hypothetical protein
VSLLKRIPRVAAVSAFMALAAACNARPPLAHTSPSPETLARAVLDAVNTGDRARLETIALSEAEFRDHVWPELPAARPERNLPLSYVWGDLQQKSSQQLSVTLRQHGGKRYALVKLTFSDVTPYAGFKVHRKATFHVRDASGHETDVRLCGSMIEQDGAWKVFSYVVED